MNFVIESFIGAGPIKFGMSRQDVKNLSLGTVRSFKRGSSEALPSDQFADVGIIVSYELSGEVDAIEFSRRSIPIFAGTSLFDLTVDQLKSLLANKDPNLKVDGDSFISHGVGVGAYVLGADDDDEDTSELVSVIAFKKGYYDD